MINLLSPEVKDQLRYARYNRVALRYLRLIVGVVVVIGAIFAVTIFYLNNRAAIVARDVAAKQAELQEQAAFRREAQDASDRLLTIKRIQESQTRFSLLLNDLAKVLPKNVSLSSITLTGDDTKPVRISVNGATYDSILAFREALAGSVRISGVDLESITQNDNDDYQANVVIGFKPGAGK